MDKIRRHHSMKERYEATKEGDRKEISNSIDELDCLENTFAAFARNPIDTQNNVSSISKLSRERKAKFLTRISFSPITMVLDLFSVGSIKASTTFPNLKRLLGIPETYPEQGT